MGKIAEVQQVTIEKLIPYVNNAKIHGDDQITHIASSIREFGFLNPIIIDRDFNVIAGHGRIMASKKLGLSEVPCLFVEGLSEAQRKAYILADNKLGELAEWNMELVTSELEALKDMDFDIDLTGFDMPEIEFDEENEIEEPPLPDNVKKRCKMGDVWEIGGVGLFVEIAHKTQFSSVLWTAKRQICSLLTRRMDITINPMREQRQRSLMSLQTMTKYLIFSRIFSDMLTAL